MEFTHRCHLEGILKYVRDNRCNWDVLIDLQDVRHISVRSLRERGFDGIIAAACLSADRAACLQSDIPTVLYEPTRSSITLRNHRPNLVVICNDHEAEGRAAADYFLARGSASFAFVGATEQADWSDQRLAGFDKRLAEAGFKASIFPRSPTGRPSSLMRDSDRLTRWIAKLPPRTALLAANDARARQVIGATTNAELRIPDDLSVLGVDDDELLCLTSAPTLSSIRVSARENGTRFAAALDDLFNGRPHEPVQIVRNTTIVTRGSTEHLSCEDPILERALSYAAEHLAQRPHLPDLARAAGCSVRTLQLRAEKNLGRSLKEELLRLQLERYRRLRQDNPNQSTESLARACGFCHGSHLRRILKRVQRGNCTR